MNVLFDLVHPADALFFHHAMRMLERDGARIIVASRSKDVLTQLLDELGHPHRVITYPGEGKMGLAGELVRRNWRLMRMARRSQADVLVGFGGVASSHVGSLCGIPNIAFYDTEHAALQLSLSLPFVDEWHVPGSWTGRAVPGRTFRFPGGKQLAYLHPRHFQRSRELALTAGWDPDRENFMVRTVAWKANHDHGRSGISPEQLKEVVAALSPRGKVHISAEGALPSELEPLRYRGGALAFHHLLAHCRLYVGESITIASEAAAVAVPALLQIDKDYGYVAEQERAGLIRRFGPGDDMQAVLAEALSDDPVEYRKRSEGFAERAGDLNAYIAAQITRVANVRKQLRKSDALLSLRSPQAP